MNTKCPRCHEDQPEGTKFCTSCGARLTYEQKRVAPMAEAAFAPTLATDVPTKAGAGTPAGVVVIPQGAAAPVAVSALGTTPPPFATPPLPALTPPAAPAQAPVPASPDVAPGEDRSVVVATVAGKLVGLDARSGAVTWEHAIDAGTPQLCIGRGLVLAAVGQSLYCCDYRTGRPLWRAALSAASARVTMVLDGEAIFALGAGVVDAFDPSGRHLWSRAILPGAAASGAVGLPGNVSQADRD